MAITRGDVKTQIIRLLNKSAGYTGFSTDDKINDAIQDGVDYIVTKMALTGQGWLKLVTTITMPPTGNTASLPSGTFMVKEIRYNQNDQYIPLSYDDSPERITYTATSSVQAFPSTYRIINNNVIEFNPSPVERGANKIQIDYIAYPTRFATDGTNFPAEFEYGMTNYIKFRAASMLSPKPDPGWLKYEAQWYEASMALISKRMNMTTRVKDFDI